MKVIDIKSIIIGVLITLLILSVYGFRPETDELGHLVVKNITICKQAPVLPKHLRSRGEFLRWGPDPDHV